MNFTKINIYFIYQIIHFLIFDNNFCYSQVNKVILINKNSNWDNSYVSYNNPSSNTFIGMGEMIKWRLLDTKKQILEIKTEEPILLNFSANWKIQLLYLFPGDTLEFQTNVNDSLPYKFEGTRPTTELMFYSLLEASSIGYIKSGNSQLEVTSKLNFQYVADETLARYKKRLDFLNALNKQDPKQFSQKGLELLTKSLYYKYLSELLFPYSYGKTLESNFDNSLIPSYYKLKLRKLTVELDNDSLIYLRDYKEFVRFFAKFLMFDAGIKTTDISTQLNFYRNNFKGKIRDLLLFDEIYEYYGLTKDGSKLYEAINAIEDKAKKDTLVSIHKRSIKTLSNVALKSEIEAVNGEKISMEKLLANHSGKIIYLDFWATWCGPCLMEMPYSQSLTTEFQDKEVEFVYISVDTDKDKWQKKWPTLHKGNNVYHYLISPESSLAREMEIPPIPRYMLVEKSSQLNSYAPRPQSKEIKELLYQKLNIK